MKILAIETSHDDTSVVIYCDKQILHNFSFTQTEFHKQFGGTVPEYAARGHFVRLLGILQQLKVKQLLVGVELIAYTSHPGLIGSLHMGTIFAKALALALDLPIRAVNHMHGHIFAAAFSSKIRFPAIALIVSGGHSQIWQVDSYHQLKVLGETKDDAIGEVFDKVARKMNLGFPGGPAIDRIAQKGQNKYDFTLVDDGTFNMSFSGLKTKIINVVDRLQTQQQHGFEADVARSFQTAVVAILKSKTERAIRYFKPRSIILGGGVAANSQIRTAFKTWHQHASIPDLPYTTDNAMMIAITADLKECHDN